MTKPRVAKSVTPTTTLQTRAHLRRRFPAVDRVFTSGRFETDPAENARVEQVAVQRLATWLDQGYRLATGCVCLGAIARGRCRCNDPDADVFAWADRYWADHVNRWIARDGTRVLTSQPSTLMSMGRSAPASPVTAPRPGWTGSSIAAPRGGTPGIRP